MPGEGHCADPSVRLAYGYAQYGYPQWGNFLFTASASGGEPGVVNASTCPAWLTKVRNRAITEARPAGSPGSLAAAREMCSTVGMIIAGLMAAAFLGLIVASLVWHAWVFPAAIMALAIVWLFVDKPVEGPVIWSLPAEIGGVTVGDLVVLPAVAVGLELLRRAHRPGAVRA
jgi:hypothetical protein